MAPSAHTASGGRCHTVPAIARTALVVCIVLALVGLVFTTWSPREKISLLKVTNSYNELLTMNRSQLREVVEEVKMKSALSMSSLSNGKEKTTPTLSQTLTSKAEEKKSSTQQEQNSDEQEEKEEKDRINSTEVDSPSGSPSEVNKSSISDDLKKAHDFLYGFAGVPGNKYFMPTARLSQPCPALPTNLVGPVKVFKEAYPMAELNSLDFHVKDGGYYYPSECLPIQTVAIVIPYRHRSEHLSVLLLNLHPFLQKQQISYTIYVVNQVDGSKFNRAMLMNIGFVEAMKERHYDCIIFHDVDLLPENDKNIYTCPDNNPRHMSVAIDKFNYKLPYKDILGGIVAIKSSLFVKINGYSNQFFGWGGEDDDFSARCRKSMLTITRYPITIARYQMIKHQKDSGNEPNPKRFEMLKHVSSRQQKDGLNSLVYKVQSIDKQKLYTRINVDINQTDVMNVVPYDIKEKLPFLNG